MKANEQQVIKALRLAKAPQALPLLVALPTGPSHGAPLCGQADASEERRGVRASTGPEFHDG